jgi:protein FAM32A
VGKEVIKSKALVDALIGEDKANKATRTQSEEDSPVPGTSTPTANASASASASASSSSGKAKTDAERRFEEIQRRRLADKVAKLAKKTHKDRVHEFNTKLESLSEHHDIPKVGPG